VSSLGRFLASQGLRVNDRPAPARQGTFSGVRGIMWHHTAGTCTTASTAGEVSNARNGGLYNLLIGADVVVYVLTEQRAGQPEPGRAHHAGTGGPWQSVPANQGNAWIVGLSAQCNGAHPVATHPAQYAAMIQTTAALCRRYGLTSAAVVGHKEWTTRKIDPRDNMNTVRRDVAAALGTAPTPPPATPGLIGKDPAMVIQAPSGAWWLLQGNHLTSLTANSAANARAGGIPAFAVDAASWTNLSRTYPLVPA